LSVIAAGVFFAPDPRAAIAAPPPKRVAVLAEVGGGEEKLAREFEKHGFRPGEDLEVRAFAFSGKWDQSVPVAVAEMLRWQPDCIMVPADYFVRYVRQATRSVPIVTNASDPVGSGLAASLVRPGSNVTGVYTDPSEIYFKQIQLLLALVPKLPCAAWISFGPRLADYPAFEKAARAAGVRARTVVIETADGPNFQGLAREMRSLRREGCLAAHLLTNVPATIETVAQGALSERIVVSYGGDAANLATEGLLFSYHPAFQVRGYQNSGRMVAIIARILRGERPENIPFEGPTGYSLRLNQRTASRLGITIPPEMLIAAEEVIRQ
jgi:putative ABC transport system substrate-binding protein